MAALRNFPSPEITAAALFHRYGAMPMQRLRRQARRNICP